VAMGGPVLENAVRVSERNRPVVPAFQVWIPAVLLLAFVGQSLWFIGTQSFTYDEPGHIFAGLEAWQHGRFEMWVDHPPLGRYWLTLPLARADVEMTLETHDWRYRLTAMRPGPEWIAWRTRPMNTLLGVALGLTLWFATRRLFSIGAANVALALFAFTPSLIGHFSVATTDGIGALFIFLTAYQVVLWRSNPSRWRTLLMGLILGGLLLSKLYTPPEVVLALGLMLVLGRDTVLKRPSDWNWKPTLAALCVASVTLWAGYLFHISRVDMADGHILMTFPNRPAKALDLRSDVKLSLLLPAGEYAEGVRLVALSNRVGRETWFMGKLYHNGASVLYFPVAIALKWPTILLLFLLVSLLLGVRKTCRSPSDLLVISLFGLLFLALALQSRITIGERHVLPLYAFALLIAGGVWEHVRLRRAAVLALVVALGLNAADALRYAPNYLAYFNIFVRSADRWHLLADSNLDWGQGLIAARSYQEQHQQTALYLLYFGAVAPELYGVRATNLVPHEPVNGTVIASPNCLVGRLCGDYGDYNWLQAYQPTLEIDHSMWIVNTIKPGRK